MAWLLWLGGALVGAIIEMFTLDFIFIMLAGGALGGMIAALVGGNVVIQVIAFAAVSVLLLFLVRPAAKAWMDHHTPDSRTNVHALIGRTAEVVARVTDDGGRVKLVGEVWTARAARPHEVFEEGRDVLVVAIDGAYAVVTGLEEQAFGQGEVR